MTYDPFQSPMQLQKLQGNLLVEKEFFDNCTDLNQFRCTTRALFIKGNARIIRRVRLFSKYY